MPVIAQPYRSGLYLHFFNMQAFDRTSTIAGLQRVRVELGQRQKECLTYREAVRDKQEKFCIHYTAQTPLRHTLSYLNALTDHCNTRSDRLERHGWHSDPVYLASTIIAVATPICSTETAECYTKRTLAKTARALWACESAITAEEDSMTDLIGRMLEIQKELLANEQSPQLAERVAHVGQVEELLGLVAGRRSSVDFFERVQWLNDMSVDCRTHVGGHERTIHEYMLFVSELGIVLPRQTLVTEYFKKKT